MRQLVIHDNDHVIIRRQCFAKSGKAMRPLECIHDRLANVLDWRRPWLTPRHDEIGVGHLVFGPLEPIVNFLPHVASVTFGSLYDSKGSDRGAESFALWRKEGGFIMAKHQMMSNF